MFITERGFQTNLHNDHQHYAFIASMCQGRKRWRILTNSELAAHAKEMDLIDPEGPKQQGETVDPAYRGAPMVDGHLVLADMKVI